MGPMKLNGRIKVRQDVPLLKSGVKAAGKIFERHGSAGMTKGTQ